jgi:hypothetical protein
LLQLRQFMRGYRDKGFCQRCGALHETPPG